MEPVAPTAELRLPFAAAVTRLETTDATDDVGLVGLGSRTKLTTTEPDVTLRMKI